MDGFTPLDTWVFYGMDIEEIAAKLNKEVMNKKIAMSYYGDHPCDAPKNGVVTNYTIEMGKQYDLPKTFLITLTVSYQTLMANLTCKFEVGATGARYKEKKNKYYWCFLYMKNAAPT